MKKTVKSILCSLFMAFLAINPAQSQQGTAGSLDWEIADGILTISGKGGIPAYSETRKAPWSEYKDSFTAIVIEDGVTQIRDYAFYDCPAVVSVSIGDSVINIGQHAFARCSKLASVAIPGKTSKIDAYAFDSCTSLESVEIFPESATLGAGLFRNCTSLKKITCHAPYGYGISTQSPGVFEGVDLSICTLYVPAGAATMYEMMGWNGFGAIKTIGEEEIGGEAGPLAWDLTDGMLTISGQEAMPAYTESNKAPWDTYKDQITSVSIKDGVTSIGDYAFYGCSSIVSVNIGQNVATIGRNAFAQCTGLTSILIPASVTRLNGYDFEGCSSLASIEILTQSAYFDSGIFRNCKGLKMVINHATKPQTISHSVFSGVNLAGCTLRIPAEAVGTYRQAEVWKDFGSFQTLDGMPAFDYVTDTVNGVSFDMAFVPGGTFTMGGTEEQGPTVGADEFPIHSVTLDSFLIGATEVTQELWLAVMGVWPTSLDPVEDSFFMPSAQHGLGDNYPAYYISWNDAQLFLSKLNELTGKYFRLPTESEWEYAARGAKNDSDMYSGGNDENIDEIAWYKGNNDYDPTPYNHPVATKKPNELGLYDMSGNVLEWCSDWYTDYPSEDQTNPTGPAWGTSKVNRGGHSMSYAMAVRTAIRYASYPEERSNSYGFRIVRDFRTRYKVSLSANIPEGGMVAMQGNSTDGMFLAGETVVLMAIPNMGYTFVNWTENGEVVSTEASYTFTIESDRDLMANFALEETEEKFSVRFNTPENGTLSILAGDKPLASGDSVAEGTEVTITAAPAQEYVLDVLQLNGIDIENGHTHAVTTDVEILTSFKLRTGIENGISKNIRVYPNPVEDMLHIEASVDIEEVRIYSLDGRLTRQAAHPQSRIDMSGLPSGLYLLRIKAAGNEHIVKIVKK